MARWAFLSRTGFTHEKFSGNVLRFAHNRFSLQGVIGSICRFLCGGMFRHDLGSAQAFRSGFQIVQVHFQKQTIHEVSHVSTHFQKCDTLQQQLKLPRKSRRSRQ